MVSRDGVRLDVFRVCLDRDAWPSTAGADAFAHGRTVCVAMRIPKLRFCEGRVQCRELGVADAVRGMVAFHLHTGDAGAYNASATPRNRSEVPTTAVHVSACNRANTSMLRAMRASFGGASTSRASALGAVYRGNGASSLRPRRATPQGNSRPSGVHDGSARLP